MTDQELRDELMTLLVAGHETTASTLAWCFDRLARDPGVLERLRLADDAYLTATVQEALRCRPVLPNPPAGGQADRGRRMGLSHRRLSGTERVSRPPRFGDLSGPVCLPPGAVRGAGPRDLQLDSLWRRPAPLPRSELCHVGDEDRAPVSGPRAGDRARGESLRPTAAAEHHDRSGRRVPAPAASAWARAGCPARCVTRASSECRRWIMRS
jgi:hypothetical protein